MLLRSGRLCRKLCERPARHEARGRPRRRVRREWAGRFAAKHAVATIAARLPEALAALVVDRLQPPEAHEGELGPWARQYLASTAFELVGVRVCTKCAHAASPSLCPSRARTRFSRSLCLSLARARAPARPHCTRSAASLCRCVYYMRTLVNENRSLSHARARAAS